MYPAGYFADWTNGDGDGDETVQSINYNYWTYKYITINYKLLQKN